MIIMQESIGVDASDVGRILDTSPTGADTLFHLETVNLALEHTIAQKDEIRVALEERVVFKPKVWEGALIRLKSLQPTDKDLSQYMSIAQLESYDDVENKADPYRLTFSFEYLPQILTYYETQVALANWNVDLNLAKMRELYLGVDLSDIETILTAKPGTVDWNDYSNEAAAATGRNIHNYNIARGNYIGATLESRRYQSYVDSLSVLPFASNAILVSV